MYCCFILLNALFYLLRVLRILFFPHYLEDRYIDNSTDVISIYDKYVSTQPETIVSWNVHGLPLFMNSSVIQEIVNKIMNFNCDIVCIQECFSDVLLDKIKKQATAIYPYLITGNLNKKYIFGENSGLIILSKYPITFQLFHNYKAGVGCDSLSNKGYLIVNIGKINIVNTHLQSNELNICCSNIEKIIEAQIEELKQYLPFENTILCGDFNTEKLEKYITITNNNKRNTLNSIYFRKPQVLDYIVSLHDDYQVKVKVLDMEKNPSDHKPVKATIIKS